MHSFRHLESAQLRRKLLDGLVLTVIRVLSGGCREE